MQQQNAHLPTDAVGFAWPIARVCFLAALLSILGGLLGLNVLLARMAERVELASAQPDPLMFTSTPQATQLRRADSSVLDARAVLAMRAEASKQPVLSR